MLQRHYLSCMVDSSPPASQQVQNSPLHSYSCSTESTQDANQARHGAHRSAQEERIASSSPSACLPCPPCPPPSSLSLSLSISLSLSTTHTKSVWRAQVPHAALQRWGQLHAQSVLLRPRPPGAPHPGQQATAGWDCRRWALHAPLSSPGRSHGSHRCPRSCPPCCS